MMNSVRAVVFDAYGTLFDVHSVATECERLFPGNGASLSRVWRTKQLEYTWLRSLMGHYADFESVTRDALIGGARSMGLVMDKNGIQRLMASYLALSLFPDVREAMAQLAGYRCAILSNGSPGMLRPLVSQSGIGAQLDAVISVDELKIFKPHPSVYALVGRYLSVETSEVAFVSSNFWDICGATAYGFNAFWINRSGYAADELGFSPKAVVDRLTDLPAALLP